MKRTPIKYKRKPKSAEARRHHQHVGSLPCCACGSSPVECHHVRHDGRKSISKDDKLVVPLCPQCHRTGPQAVHAIGHPAFNELHDINLYERAVRLWETRDV